MQDVAREMNLAETAFLHPENGDYRLRWFTPAVEVALCGHATLASAHVLWEEGHLPAGREARFHTQSGLLTARRAGDWIELDFPATPPAPAPQPAGLVDELLELRGRRTEPGRRPERERIGPRQVRNRGLGDRRGSVGVAAPLPSAMTHATARIAETTRCSGKQAPRVLRGA